VEAARDTIFTLAPTGILTSMSAQFTAALGWAREEWLGRSLADLVHPDDLPQVQTLLAQAPHLPPLPAFELRLLTKAGGWVATECNVTVLTEEGHVAGLLGVARDITERKRLEDDLIRSNQDLERHVAERTAALSNEIVQRQAREAQLRTLWRAVGAVGSPSTRWFGGGNRTHCLPRALPAGCGVCIRPGSAIGC
jgi:PAS domain S-box-containing protein